MMWKTVIIVLVVGTYLCDASANTQVIQADSIDHPDDFDTDDFEEMTALMDNIANMEDDKDSYDSSSLDDDDADDYDEDGDDEDTLESATTVADDGSKQRKVIYKIIRGNCNNIKYYNGYWYTYTTSRMTFSQARRYCKIRGGSLAYKNMGTIPRRRRLYQMFPKIRSNKTWIGVRYCRRRWRYMNNQCVNRRTFGWKYGEPNLIRTEHCTETASCARVSNIPCSFRRAVLCEYRK